MTHEFVEVNSPRPPREPWWRRVINAMRLEPQGSSRTLDHAHTTENDSRHRVLDPARLAIAFGCGALIAAGVIWFVPGSTGAVNDAEPGPSASDGPLSGAQIATAQAYAEYEARVEAVACSAELGYPYEAEIINLRDQVPDIAEYLGLVPEPRNSAAPVPLLRQPDLYLDTYGTVDETVPGTRDCPVAVESVEADDAQRVRELASQAGADPDFATTVAEQAWASAHPADVTHAVALLRPDREDPTAEDPSAQQYWGRVHDVVEQALAEETVWVPAVRTRADTYAQTTGLIENGSAVALRVGTEAEQLGVGSYLTRVDVIRCADVTISAGVRMPWGSASDLKSVTAALAPACNALIAAGFVEAETLAEVYWD
ncbi:hypothetical protein [Demequina globuliformis]|uniref:hypothetical protein n=1 Tax=Demequina globuliformis TaxID=676202 RepID=UPI000781264D|nr:hypothetical protein [Demequina globuliformis]